MQRLPIGQKFAISRRRVRPRVNQKISGIDRVFGAELERLRIAAHHPQRGVWSLRRLYRDFRIVSVELFSMKGERLGLPICGAYVVDKLEGRRFAVAVIKAERTKVVGVDARDEAK